MVNDVAFFQKGFARLTVNFRFYSTTLLYYMKLKNDLRSKFPT